MRRSSIAILAAGALLAAATMAGAAALSIVGSKHDLSAVTGPGPIKSSPTASGGSGQTCAFCHTPHSAVGDAPLWNRSLPVGSYATYTSDVLSGLNYAIEDPLSTGAAGYAVHVKTRICMSCHDGTIALGTLVNYPAGALPNMPFLGTTGGTMPTSAAGYIGSDIRDDHPVAVKHQPGGAAGQDPELKAIDTTTKVRVYNVYGSSVKPSQTSGDYVECTSCHDAHDNQYGNFLIDDNVGSKLCRSCHTKEGYFSVGSSALKESMHSNTTFSTSYAPPTGGTPSTLGGSMEAVKCMDCHFPHKAGIASLGGNAPNPGAGKYLLTYQEELSCFNTTNRWGQTPVNVCHGSGATTTKNIESQVARTSAHRVGNYSFSAAPHNVTEGVRGSNWTALAGNSWHVECSDCHNVHTAGGQLHTIGTNTVTSTQSLYGAGGAEPAWSASNWPASLSYTYLEPTGALRSTVSSSKVAREYQVCLRCHSTFAWNTSPAPGTYTDQAKEFNTGNSSFHPVAGVNGSTQGTPVAPWTTGSQTMYCSDCHGTNIAGEPAGPHGSTASPGYILVRNYQDYYVAKGSFVPTTDLCFLCHSETVYQSGTVNSVSTGFSTATGSNLHTVHKLGSSSSVTSNTGYSCVNCHVKIPHGYKNKGMVVTNSDAGDQTTYATGGASKIASWTAPLPGAYVRASCSTVAGCH